MTYRIEFPPGTRLISANGRSSKLAVSANKVWEKREVTKLLREMGCKLAKKAAIPQLDKVRVRAIYYPPNKARRDSSNVLFHSSKAALDGFTDAQIWRDDNDKVVRSLELMPGDRIIPGGQMVIEIEVYDE